MYAEGSWLGKSEQCSKRIRAKIAAWQASFQILRCAAGTLRQREDHLNYMNI
jgi:hypothetical protein